MNAPVRKSSLAAVAVLALAACGGSTEPTTTDKGYTLDLVQHGKLTVCTHLPYVPFEFRDDDDNVVGFDMDLMDRAAEEIGVERTIVDIKFDPIKSGAAMAGGTCDIAAAGMTITEEREKNLTFSDPYFDEVLAFMSPVDAPITSIDQVKDQDLTLGVQVGTTNLDYALDNGVDPTQFDDSGKLLQALRSGTIDVILQDVPVINEWLRDDAVSAEFAMDGEVDTGAQYGFAFKKDAERELVDAVNKSLADVRESGEYDEIYEKWFGTEPAGS
ncbi:transporter substrate-binding domain-containing protein [Salininema proteolyticum]|uniref:Transporter substrate-binding domain-containing protein n=1 Tax=Salininema proteolyticum TaxID=1607685 RepID=A0ABV8U378_9ACTN